MNMKTLLYIIALTCTAAACSKSEQPVGGGYPADGVVRISPTVAAPLTRAEEGTEGSTAFSGSRLSLGLYYGDNDKYSKTALWKKDADGKWNSSSQLLWKNAEDEVVVYAYVPDDGSSGYDQAIIAPSGGIPSDQSAGLESADWLWYSDKIKPGEALGSDGKLNVKMNHALLKLTVNLSFGDEFGDTAPEIKEVWLNGTMQKVYVHYKYENGGQIAIPTSQSMDIKMHKAADNRYEAIFYPSTGQKSGEKMLTVVLKDGRDYTLTLAEDLAFEKSSDGNYYLGGCAYSMSAQVGKNKVQMGTIKVAPWNDKSSAGDFFTDATEYSEWDGSEDVATAYAGGDGSEGSPYEIATAAQLAFLAQEVVKGNSYASTYFQLTGNIDLMGYDWTPIGYNDSYPFAGIFDGNGKTILNLKVSKGMYSGLFGVASGTAVIKNLSIRKASVASKVIGAKAAGTAGIVAGWCDGGSISGCSVEGTVSGDCYVGGIAGWIQNGSISGCAAEISCMAENGSYSACGGIAGRSYSTTIENCTVRGEVKGTYMAGGFVGDMEEGGAIKRTQYDDPLYCYADVSLYEVCKPSSGYTEKYYVGGLVGKCSRSSSATVSIKSVNVSGKVSLPDGLDIHGGVVNLGGYTGYVDNASISGYFLGSIEAGTPANGTLNAGAFIGMLGAGVKAEYCKYYSSKVGDLPVYRAKADGADDSGLKITTFD